MHNIPKTHCQGLKRRVMFRLLKNGSANRKPPESAFLPCSRGYSHLIKSLCKSHQELLQFRKEENKWPSLFKSSTSKVTDILEVTIGWKEEEEVMPIPRKTGSEALEHRLVAM